MAYENEIFDEVLQDVIINLNVQAIPESSLNELFLIGASALNTSGNSVYIDISHEQEPPFRRTDFEISEDQYGIISSDHFARYMALIDSELGQSYSISEEEQQELEDGTMEWYTSTTLLIEEDSFEYMTEAPVLFAIRSSLALTIEPEDSFLNELFRFCQAAANAGFMKK